MGREIIIEALAKYAHKAWSGWMKYLFSKSIENPDGSYTIPKKFANRWKRQMNSSYENLPLKERASDVVEAKLILSTYYETRYVFDAEGS